MAPPAIALLTGDPLLIRERLAKLQRDAVGDRPAFGALEVLHGDASDLEAIATAVRTIAPGGRRLVVVRQAEKLREDVQRSLIALLGEVPSGTRVVLIAESVDLRRALFAALRERGAVERLEIGSSRDPAATRRGLADLVEGHATRLGLRLRPEAVRTLLEFTDNDPSRLVSELEKLALRWGENEIDAARALDSLGGERALRAFALEGAVRERRVPRAIAELRALLAQGERPEVIVGQLAGEIRALLRARALLDSGLGEEGAKRAFGGGRGYFVVPQARAWRGDELVGALERLRGIDLATKTGAGAVPARLERWVLDLARAQAR